MCNSFNYTLISGNGDTDNGSFTIVGDKLLTAAVFDYETKSSNSVRVHSTDSGGLYFEKVFVITVTNANEEPTDITLSNDEVPENKDIGTLIGSFNTIDVESGDEHSYSLVIGVGDIDNASFSIAGNQLLTAEVFDFETKSSNSIRGSQYRHWRSCTLIKFLLSR